MKYDIPRTPSYLDSALNFHWYGFVLTGVTIGALRWNTAATNVLDVWGSLLDACALEAETDADALSELGVGSGASATDMDADGLDEDTAYGALADAANAEALEDDRAAAILEATASALIDEADGPAAPHRPGMDDEDMAKLVIVLEPDITDALDTDDEEGRLPSPTSSTSSPPALWLGDAAELEPVESATDAAEIDPDAETV